MSPERTTELTVKALIGLKTETPVVTHDDKAQTDEFSGIVVSAKSDGVISSSASGDRTKRVETVDVTVSIRSMIPTLDADGVAGLWQDITDAILSPVLPDGATGWVMAIPALQNAAYFRAVGQTTSDRDDDDDRRTHTRTFRFFVAVGEEQFEGGSGPGFPDAPPGYTNP
jgi:hypothetical protein